MSDFQQMALDLGFKYWRASDAHGVTCTKEQAEIFIANLVGVEVGILSNENKLYDMAGDSAATIDTNPETLVGALGAVLKGVAAGQYREVSEAAAVLEAVRCGDCRHEYGALWDRLRAAVGRAEDGVALPPAAHSQQSPPN